MPAKYIITFYNSNQEQIKDMDFSIDNSLDFIEFVEKFTNIKPILPMENVYIPDYINLMNLNGEINDEELASVWFCSTEKKIMPMYNITYDDKKYTVKFHNI
jgi:hypothetical protein